MDPLRKPRNCCVSSGYDAQLISPALAGGMKNIIIIHKPTHNSISYTQNKLKPITNALFEAINRRYTYKLVIIPIIIGNILLFIVL